MPERSSVVWRRAVTLACCGLLGLTVVRAVAGDEPWPMYQANPAHTGYLPVTLNPSNFAPRWSVTIHSGVALNPVTAADGLVLASENTYFGDAGLYSLDAATGNVLWSTNFGSVFSVNPPSYAYGNVYIQTCDNYGDTFLHSFQAATGVFVFRSPHAAQWEHYFAPTIFDGNVYVDGGEYGGMYSFNANSGVQNWFGYVGQYDGWTPAVDTNFCYTFTGSGDTVPITGEFRIIDRASGNNLYLVTDYAFQWNGYTMNEAVTLGANEDAFAINEPGSVYPGYGPNGRLLMFDLRMGGGNTPHIGWVLSDHFTGQVTLANGVLYVNDGGILVALDEVTGSSLWTWTPPSGSLTGTIIATDNLLFAGTGTATYAIDLVSHQTVWSSPVGGALALGEGVLYVAGSDGTLTAINAASANQPPVCRIGGPYTAECQGAATVVQLDGSASSDPQGKPLTFQWNADCPGATFDNPASPTPKLTMDTSAAQTCTVSLVVSDGQLTNSAQAVINIVDTTPPVLIGASNKVVQCGSNWDFDLPATSDACCGTNVTVTVLGTLTNTCASGSCLESYTRTWVATDCSGNTNTCSQTVTVVDTQPPVLSRISADPATLWPPNHKLVSVTIAAVVTDTCDPAPTWWIASVTSSDSSSRGDKDSEPDYQITGAHTLLLRADRDDAHAGRTYQINLDGKDASGNTATASVLVTVPGSGK